MLSPYEHKKRVCVECNKIVYMPKQFTLGGPNNYTEYCECGGELKAESGGSHDEFGNLSS